MSGELRIAVAGLGTVGAGVVQLLQQQAGLIRERAGRAIRVVAVSARDANKDRGFDRAEIEWVDDAAALAARTDVDVIVELIGGSEGIARTLVEAALSSGKSVVTANKALIAHRGAELAAAAEKANQALLFEAAVAGGIPIIDVLQHGVAANRFSRIAGILNGTCNYILTTMRREAREFEDVLAEAQALGYAEADPSFDIDGIDTAHKLAILTSLACCVKPSVDAIHIEGIRHITQRDMEYAAELGFTIKLLGLAQATTDGGVLQRVHPCLVPHDAPIARIAGAFNAVQVEGHAVGRVLLEGAGAGAGPTASSVVADLMQLARGHQTLPLTIAAAALKPLNPSPIHLLTSRYYIRLTVLDQPGVLAEVTRIFADERISVQSLIQHDHDSDTPAQVVITTHETIEASMQNALARIAALDTVVSAPQMLRVQPF